MQASFKGISREKYFNVHIKNPFQPPPVGVYRTRFDGKDPKVTVPIYGSKEKWGGDLAKKATMIKEIDFKKKVKACPRIDRTLVYQR